MKEEDVSGGSLGEVPNDKYKKFFVEMQKYTETELTIWKPAHLLGFFCTRFKSTFNKDYDFKFNSPSPSKSFEIFQIKKLSQHLSSKPSILKEYIDWVFEEKVIKPKKSFRSISFLNTENFLKEYKWKVLSNSQLTRTTALPTNILATLQDFIELAKSSGIFIELKTYGDLSFLVQAINSNGMPQGLIDMWKLISPSLDLTVLEKIK